MVMGSNLTPKLHLLLLVQTQVIFEPIGIKTMIKVFWGPRGLIRMRVNIYIGMVRFYALCVHNRCLPNVAPKRHSATKTVPKKVLFYRQFWSHLFF